MKQDIGAARQGVYQWPETAETKRSDVGAVVVYLFEKDGKPLALGFVGRRKKAAFFNHFATAHQRDQYAENWLTIETRKAKDEQARKAFEHTLKIGDLVYTSWGYDQTNVDFYEVVALKGKRTVVLRARNTEITGNGVELSMSGYAMPAPGFLNDELLTRRVGEGNVVKIKSYASGYQWDGKKKGTTWYG